MQTGAVSVNKEAREITGHVATVYMDRGQLNRRLRQSAELLKDVIVSVVFSHT